MILIPTTMTYTPTTYWPKEIYPRLRHGRTIANDLDSTFRDIFRIMNDFTDEVSLPRRHTSHLIAVSDAPAVPCVILDREPDS
jgi:hypothetical protein